MDKHAPARKSNHDIKVSMRSSILAAAADERLELVVSHLSSLVGKILGFTQTKVDRQQSLHRLGIDSLMAVELKNAIERDLDLAFPVTMLLKGPTLNQLAQDLLDQLSAETDEQSAAPLLEPVLSTTEDEVRQLSDQQIDELLSRYADAEEFFLHSHTDNNEVKQ
jgi:acyl carrier protein